MSNQYKNLFKRGRVKKTTPYPNQPKQPKDKLTKFFIAVTVLVTLFIIYMGISFTMMTVDKQKYHFYDEYLNLSLIVPKEWNLATPDKEAVKEAVFQSTGGILFDMEINSLQEEIVPIALAVKPKDGGTVFEKFMTLAYRGSDSEYSYLKDKVKLMDDFRHLLKTLNHKNIKVDKVEDFQNDNMLGILLQGSGVLEGTKVYYYQYFEPAGANTLTITYGTTNKRNKAIKDIDTILKNLLYHRGGEYLPTPIQDEMREEAIKQREREQVERESQEQEEQEEAREETNETDETTKPSSNIEVKVESTTDDIEIKDEKGNKITEPK